MNAKSNPSAAHLALRQATSQLHTEVESRLPLSAPSVGITDYLTHIEFMRDWVGEFPEWPTRDSHLDDVTRALTRDIAIADALLANPAVTRRPAVTACVSETAGLCPGAAWGFAYVLHGSQLGNQVLYRRLLDVLAPHPLNYLRGAGSETPKRWKQFLALLAENVTSTQQIDESCAGAVAAFETLLRIVAPKKIA